MYDRIMEAYNSWDDMNDSKQDYYFGEEKIDLEEFALPERPSIDCLMWEEKQELKG